MRESPPSPVLALDRINLRLPAATFGAIDHARSARPGSVSRNTWISEAIEEKLVRDGAAELSAFQERLRHG